MKAWYNQSRSPREVLRFLLAKACALTIICFGQQAKNYMVHAETLVGMFQMAQLKQSFGKIADHYMFLI